MFSTKIDDSATSLNMPQASLISWNQNDQDVGVAIVSFMAHWAVYIIIFGLTLIILAMIIELLKDCERDVTTELATASETNRLLPKDVIYLEYGTCDEEDLEARKWSRSGSSEDLYDGKICVICYEGQRNCFFVPCGHCVTCFACAERIMEWETKTCPICRRLVHKGDQEDWDIFLSFALRLVIYVIVLALTLIIVSLIVKYLRNLAPRPHYNN